MECDAKKLQFRNARPDEIDTLSALSSAEGMDPVPSEEDILVATDEKDQVAGFIRLQQDIAGIWYVNPIVVAPDWRGYGVGRALIEEAYRRVGELRLVARGDVIPFYEKLGFVELGWDEVDLEAASEHCNDCPIRDTCGPLPMKKV